MSARASVHLRTRTTISGAHVLESNRCMPSSLSLSVFSLPSFHSIEINSTASRMERDLDNRVRDFTTRCILRTTKPLVNAAFRLSFQLIFLLRTVLPFFPLYLESLADRASPEERCQRKKEIFPWKRLVFRG